MKKETLKQLIYNLAQMGLLSQKGAAWVESKNIEDSDQWKELMKTAEACSEDY